jgi:hypothetical protein
MLHKRISPALEARWVLASEAATVEVKRLEAVDIKE